MKTTLTIFFTLIMLLGIYSGVKGNWSMCDDPQCDTLTSKE